jgi:hypothetical protein
MGNIHYLSTPVDAQARLLEQWIAHTIAQHTDKDVARRWMEMASETARKYPGPPHPSQSELELAMLSDMDTEQREAVLGAVQAYLESYFNDVRGQLMSIHGDILRLQKRVAELETAAMVAKDY